MKHLAETFSALLLFAAFGIDTALVRIAFLIAIFAGGLGVVAYVIAAAGMLARPASVPGAPAGAAPPANTPRRSP